MNADRTVLSDAMWARIENVLPGRVVDALGYLVRFAILPGQAHDLKRVSDLLESLGFGALVGDRAFDADWLMGELNWSCAGRRW